MEVPRLGVKLDLELLAGHSISKQDLSHVFNLHHSSWQCRIADILSKARDGTQNLMDTSWICFHCGTTGTPFIPLFLKFLNHPPPKKTRSSLMAQQVKDLVLSLQWHRSLLWPGLDPWPGSFHIPWVWPKKPTNQPTKSLVLAPTRH